MTSNQRSMIKAVRGTRDLLPPETALWNFVEAAVRDVFRAYNFQEIRTPIFESTELFARGVGEETDIVSKEMYTFDDGKPDDQMANAWLSQQSLIFRNALPSLSEDRPRWVVETQDTVFPFEAEITPRTKTLAQLHGSACRARHVLANVRPLLAPPPNLAV